MARGNMNYWIKKDPVLAQFGVTDEYTQGTEVMKRIYAYIKSHKLGFKKTLEGTFEPVVPKVKPVSMGPE